MCLSDISYLLLLFGASLTASLITLEKNAFIGLHRSKHLSFEQTCIYRVFVLTFVTIQDEELWTQSSNFSPLLFWILLFYEKGRSARRLSRGLADEISTHDGPGCGVCEDDVGRRLASSPEALLRQEVVGQIIPAARKVPLMPSALSGLISLGALSLSMSIRVTGFPRGNR
ncbi:hypothetical protein P5V15_008081 [Pogonomyrmex californicus]